MLRYQSVDELGERNVLEARAAEVPRARRRHDEDRLAGRGEAAAVVDVLEPRRRELLVERADLVEHFAAQQQRRGGRLLDRLRMRQTPARDSGSAPSSRLRGKELVDAEDFADERAERRQAAQLELALRVARFVGQQRRRGGDDRIRVEKFDQRSPARAARARNRD